MKFKLLAICACLVINVSAFGSTHSSKAQDETLTTHDKEILSWLIQVDKNEINAAHAILKKTDSKDVNKFAHAMLSDHNKNLKASLRMDASLNNSPIKTDAVMQLKKEGKAELSEIKSLKKGKKAAIQYANDMVKGHAAVLEKIDNDYLKNVKNPKLEKLLKVTRDTVNHHLKEAQALQQNLNG